MAKSKITPERIRMMDGWSHSGFHFHAGPRIRPDDKAAMETLAGCVIPKEARRNWSSLIRRIYEFDPLLCSIDSTLPTQHVLAYGALSTIDPPAILPLQQSKFLFLGCGSEPWLRSETEADILIPLHDFSVGRKGLPPN